MQSNHSDKIKTVPDNYTTVTPWIISASSEKLIEFLKAVFDAQEIPNSKIKNEAGAVIHVVVRIGDALIMLFDSKKEWNPTPAFLNLYVEDIERTYQKALQHGAESTTDITTLWFGEKVSRILDPFGNLWWINQRVEEVDPTNVEEFQKRATTPEAIQGIQYIQQSLNDSLIRQKKFFEKKITV